MLSLNIIYLVDLVEIVGVGAIWWMGFLILPPYEIAFVLVC
jgi:hypothetical protein